MANTFAQRITLEGAENILAQLKALGEQGKAAFAGLASAVESASPSLSKLSDSIGTLKTKLAPVADAASNLGNSFKGLGAPLKELGDDAAKIAAVFGVTFTASISGIAFGLFEVAKSASATINAIAGLAAETGSSVESMSQLVGALEGLGVSSEGLETSFKRLAVNVQTQWAEIQKSISDAALLIQQNNLRVQQSTNALALAQVAAAFQEKEAAALRVSNAQSVRGAFLSLLDAQERLRVIRGGDPDPQFAQEMAEQRALLAVQEARSRLEQARRKQQEDADAAALKEKQDQLNLQKLALDLAEAQKKAIEDTANSVSSAQQLVDNLSQSGKRTFVEGFGLTKEVLPTVDNIIKGLVAKVGDGISAVDQFGTSLTDLASRGPNVSGVIGGLADLFKGTHDEALNTAVAVKLFGRGVSEDLVRALSQGSGAIKEEGQRLKDLGLTFDEADAKTSRAFSNSINTLQSELKLVAAKVGGTFQPILTDLVKSLSGFLESNIGNIKAGAQSLLQQVAPIAQALTNLISGKSIEDFASSLAGRKLPLEQLLNVAAWQQRLTAMKDAAVAFVTGVGRLFTERLGPAISAVRGFLDTLAAALKRLFGINITGTALGIALLVGQLTGANAAILAFGSAITSLLASLALLGAALVVVGGGLAAVSAAAGIFIAGFAAGFAIVASLILIWEAVKQATFEAWGAISGAVEAAWETIKSIVNAGVQTLTSVWESVKAAGLAAWTAISGIVQAAWGNIRATILSGVSGLSSAWDGIKTAATAAWATIVQAAAALPGRITAALGNLGAQLGATWNAVTSAAAAAFNAIVQGAAALPGQISGALVGLGAQLASGWEEVKAAATTAWNSIVQGASALPDQIAGALGGLADAIAAPFRSAVDTVMGILQGLVGLINSIIDRIRNLGGTISQAATQLQDSGNPSPFASGGYVRGSGTSTSDSILARLSRGEFVINARAVQHWGTGFFAALNSLRMPSFSLGGFVQGLNTSLATSLALPRFAEGGLVDFSPAPARALHPVALSINGGQVVHVHATGDAVEQMRRAAVLARARSAGTKPDWYA